MKYKIGELEVEAVQWNRSNLQEFKKILNPIIEVDTALRYLMIYDGSETILLDEGDFLVKTEETMFMLSEDEFNKMATKVEEPKFKVGDVVYYFEIDSEEDNRGIDFFRLTITNVSREGAYLTDTSDSTTYYKSELLTLEEAIEKLKEL